MRNDFNEFEILSDWLKNLIDRAIKIDTSEEIFNQGVLQGYYECLSHILIQLECLDLIEKLNDQYLQNFNPDDLLSGIASDQFKYSSLNEEE